MTKKYSGFTLLELMIAITIIGILASLAVPSYQDYTVRAKISEALNMASAAKFAVSEYYIAQGKLPASTAEAGMTSVTTDYMQSITYQKTDSAGEIVLTLSEDIGGTANSKKVILEVTVEDNFLKWKCKPDDTDGPDGKYLPASCR